MAGAGDCKDDGSQQRTILRLWALTLSAIFGFHFAATALYLTPPNPVRIALHQPLEGYIHPYCAIGPELFSRLAWVELKGGL